MEVFYFMTKYLIKTRYTDLNGDEIIRYTGKPENPEVNPRGRYIEYPTSSQLLEFVKQYGFNTKWEAATCPITLFIDITSKQISESQQVTIIELECVI